MPRVMFGTMRVLLTGGNGQLAQDIAAHWTPHEIFPCNRDSLDISDAEAVNAAVMLIHPHCIINTAAFHFVDLCEERVDDAFRVNVGGVANLARAARGVGAIFVQFSTDFIFDGAKRTPYVETDEAHP